MKNNRKLWLYLSLALCFCLKATMVSAQTEVDLSQTWSTNKDAVHLYNFVKNMYTGDEIKAVRYQEYTKDAAPIVDEEDLGIVKKGYVLRKITNRNLPERLSVTISDYPERTIRLQAGPSMYFFLYLDKPKGDSGNYIYDGNYMHNEVGAEQIYFKCLSKSVKKDWVVEIEDYLAHIFEDYH